MPIYEFKCPNCEGVHELIVGSSDTVLCPTCLRTMEKQISVPAKAQFKGSGFYETDYKKSKKD